MNAPIATQTDNIGSYELQPHVVVEPFGHSFNITLTEDNGTKWTRVFVPFIQGHAPCTSYVIRSWKEQRDMWTLDPGAQPLKLTYLPDVVHWKAYVRIHPGTEREEGDEAIFNDEAEALSWCQQYANQENEPVTATVSRVTLYSADVTLNPS